MKKSHAFIIGIVSIITFLCASYFNVRLFVSIFMVVALFFVWLILPVISSFIAIKNRSSSGVLICALYILIISVIIPIVIGWGHLNGRHRGVPMFYITMSLCFVLSLIASFLGGTAGYFFRKKTIPNPDEHSS
ncbi:hypothetical protein [Rahnella laticis]|uniref:hypothetical protein n=1 Tax=Rahnella laticis TaxID=2787622 RepID=UPI0018A2E2D7|nr:hypothetical protein [Rahnella laticis]MBF7993929.1 hypothetical protein [Rahnella laticis]